MSNKQSTKLSTKDIVGYKTTLIRYHTKQNDNTSLIIALSSKQRSLENENNLYEHRYSYRLGVANFEPYKWSVELKFDIQIQSMVDILLFYSK